jgi:hypothetical protein
MPPRLVLPERGAPIRAAVRAAAAASQRVELHAGERAVVASAEPVRAKGELAKLLKNLGLAALVLLALVGIAALLRPDLLRPFVGL